MPLRAAETRSQSILLSGDKQDAKRSSTKTPDNAFNPVDMELKFHTSNQINSLSQKVKFVEKKYFTIKLKNLVPERCAENASHKKAAEAWNVSGNVQDEKGNELIRALDALRQQGVAPLVGCVQQQPRGHAQAFEKHKTRRKTRHATKKLVCQHAENNV